jgi:hypothetical protein
MGNELHPVRIEADFASPQEGFPMETAVALHPLSAAI